MQEIHERLILLGFRFEADERYFSSPWQFNQGTCIEEYSLLDSLDQPEWTIIDPAYLAINYGFTTEQMFQKHKLIVRFGDVYYGTTSWWEEERIKTEKQVYREIAEIEEIPFKQRVPKFKPWSVDTLEPKVGADSYCWTELPLTIDYGKWIFEKEKVPAEFKGTRGYFRGFGEAVNMMAIFFSPGMSADEMRDRRTNKYKRGNPDVPLAELYEYIEVRARCKVVFTHQRDGYYHLEPSPSFRVGITMQELKDKIGQILKQNSEARLGVYLNAISKNLIESNEPKMTNKMDEIIQAIDTTDIAHKIARSKVPHLPIPCCEQELNKMEDLEYIQWIPTTIIPSNNCTMIAHEIASIHQLSKIYPETLSCESPATYITNEHADTLKIDDDETVLCSYLPVGSINFETVLEKRGKESISFMIPNINTTAWIGELNKESTWRRIGDDIVVIPNNSTKVYTWEHGIIDACKNHMLFNINGVVYIIMHQIVGKSYTTIVLNRSGENYDLSNKMYSVSSNQEMEMTLTLPTTEGLMGDIMTTLYRKKTKINKGLLRVLIAMNLHNGEMTYQTMLTRAMGYALTQYGRYDSERTRDISLEVMRDTAYVAAVYSRLSYIKRTAIVNWMAEPKWFRNLGKYAAIAGNIAIQTALEQSPQFVQIQQGLKTAIGLFSNQMVNVEYDSMYGEIDNWLYQDDVKPWSVYNLNSSPRNILPKHGPTCTGHQGPRACNQCGASCDESENLCQCCLLSRKQQEHACAHKCHSNHNHDKLHLCACCKTLSTDNDLQLCDWCAEFSREEFDDDPFDLELIMKVQERNAPARQSTKPDDSYFHKKYNRWVRNASGSINLEGNEHAHKCSLCSKWYSHVHPHHGTNHPEFVGHCPHCEGNMESKPLDGEPARDLDTLDKTMKCRKGKVGHIVVCERCNTEYTAVNHPSQLIHDFIEDDCPICDSNVENYDHNQTKSLAEMLDNLESTGCNMDLVANYRNPTYASTMDQTNASESTAMWSFQLTARGHQRLPITDFTVKALNEIDAVSNCLILALNWQKPIRQSLFVDITEKVNGHTAEDLRKWACDPRVNANVAWIVGDHIEIICNEPNNSFYCVWLENYHWDVAQIKLNSSSHLIMTCSNQNVEQLENLKTKIDEQDTVKVKILCEQIIHSQVDTLLFQNPRLDWNYKNNVLSNNVKTKHIPKQGLFSIKVPTKYNAICSTVLVDLTGHHLESVFNPIVNISTDLTQSFENLIHYDIIQQLKHLNRIYQTATDTNDYTPHYKCTISTSHKVTTITVPQIVILKPGDQLLIGKRRQQTTIISAFPDIDRERTIITTGSINTANLSINETIYVDKQSCASTWMRLTGLCSSSLDGQETRSLIEQATMHDYAPGGGKTTTIIEKLSQGDVVVFATTGAGKALADAAEKAGKTIVSFTLESLISRKATLPRCNTLYLDEATLILPLDMHIAGINKNTVNNLQCYGGSDQITQTRSGDLPGFYKIKNVGHYCGKTEVKNTTYRFGNPLINVLNQALGKSLVDGTKEGTETTITVIPTANFNPAIIKAKHEAEGNDIILVAYNYQKNDLNRLKCNVETIHRYQGRQTDKVTVVLCSHQHVPQGGRQPDTHKNKEYIYSALTRARRHITLITNNSTATDPVTAIKLPENKKLGFGKNYKQSVMNLINHGFKTTTKQITASTKGIDIIEFEKTKDKYARKYKVSVSLTKLEDEDVITIKKLGMQTNVYRSHDGKYRSEGPLASLFTKERYDEMEAEIKINDNKFMQTSMRLSINTHANETIFLIKSMVHALANSNVPLTLLIEGEEVTVTKSIIGLQFASPAGRFDLYQEDSYDPFIYLSKDGVYDGFMDWIQSAEALQSIVGCSPDPLIWSTYMAVSTRLFSISKLWDDLLKIVSLENFSPLERNRKQAVRRAKLALSLTKESSHTVLEPGLHTPWAPMGIYDDQLKIVNYVSESQHGIKLLPVTKTNQLQIQLETWERFISDWLYTAIAHLMHFGNNMLNKLKGKPLRTIDWHMENNDNVALIISNHFNRMAITAHLKTNANLYLPLDTMKKWKPILAKYLPDASVAPTSSQTLRINESQSLDTILTNLLSSIADKGVYYTNNSHATIDGGAQGWIAEPTPNATTLALFNSTIRDSRAICTELNKVGEEIITKGDEKSKVYKRISNLRKSAMDQLLGKTVFFNNKHVVNTKNAVISPSVLNMTGKEFEELVFRHQAITLIVPMDESEMNTDVSVTRMEDITVIYRRDLQLEFNVPTKMLEMIKSGKNIKIGNKSYHFETKNIFIGFKVVTLNRTTGTRWFSPISRDWNMNMVNIRVPNLSISALDSLSNGRITWQRQLKVSKKLYSVLSKRMAKESMDWNTLRFAARTCVHASYITYTGEPDVYAEQPSWVEDTALAVYVHFKANLEATVEFMDANIPENNWYGPTYSHGKALVNGMLATLGTLLGANEQIDPELLIRESSLQNTIANALRIFFKELNQLEISIGEETRSVCKISEDNTEITHVTLQDVPERPLHKFMIRNIVGAFTTTDPVVQSKLPGKTEKLQPQYKSRTQVGNWIISFNNNLLKPIALEIRDDSSQMDTTASVVYNYLKSTELEPTDYLKVLDLLKDVLQNNYLQGLEELQTTKTNSNKLNTLLTNIDVVDFPNYKRLREIPHAAWTPTEKESLQTWIIAQWLRLGITSDSKDRVLNIRNTKVWIYAIGANGDMQPANALNDYLLEWGAEVTLICPDWFKPDNQPHHLYQGEYQINKLLEKWKRLQDVSASVDTILSDSLNPNWIKMHMPTHQVPDLIIGTKVGPQGALYAHIHNVPYIDYIPQTLSRASSSIQRWWANMKRDGMYRLHQDAMETEHLRITGKPLEMKKFLRKIRPQIAPIDGWLKVTNSSAHIASFNYYPREDRKMNTFNENVEIIIHFGTMSDINMYKLAIEGCDGMDWRILISTSNPAFVTLEQTYPGRIIEGPVRISALANKTEAFVHHGGAGTCMDLARAGIYQFVCPQMFDQFDNAERVELAGFGKKIELGAWITTYNIPKVNLKVDKQEDGRKLNSALEAALEEINIKWTNLTKLTNIRVNKPTISKITVDTEPILTGYLDASVEEWYDPIIDQTNANLPYGCYPQAIARCTGRSLIEIVSLLPGPVDLYRTEGTDAERASTILTLYGNIAFGLTDVINTTDGLSYSGQAIYSKKIDYLIASRPGQPNHVVVFKVTNCITSELEERPTVGNVNSIPGEISTQGSTTKFEIESVKTLKDLKTFLEDFTQRANTKTTAKHLHLAINRINKDAIKSVVGRGIQGLAYTGQITSHGNHHKLNSTHYFPTGQILYYMDHTGIHLAVVTNGKQGLIYAEDQLTTPLYNTAYNCCNNNRTTQFSEFAVLNKQTQIKLLSNYLVQAGPIKLAEKLLIHEADCKPHHMNDELEMMKMYSQSQTYYLLGNQLRQNEDLYNALVTIPKKLELDYPLIRPAYRNGAITYRIWASDETDCVAANKYNVVIKNEYVEGTIENLKKFIDAHGFNQKTSKFFQYNKLPLIQGVGNKTNILAEMKKYQTIATANVVLDLQLDVTANWNTTDTGHNACNGNHTMFKSGKTLVNTHATNMPCDCELTHTLLNNKSYKDKFVRFDGDISNLNTNFNFKNAIIEVITGITFDDLDYVIDDSSNELTLTFNEAPVGKTDNLIEMLSNGKNVRIKPYKLIRKLTTKETIASIENDGRPMPLNEGFLVLDGYYCKETLIINASNDVYSTINRGPENEIENALYRPDELNQDRNSDFIDYPHSTTPDLLTPNKPAMNLRSTLKALMDKIDYQLPFSKQDEGIIAVTANAKQVNDRGYFQLNFYDLDPLEQPNVLNVCLALELPKTYARSIRQLPWFASQLKNIKFISYGAKLKSKDQTYPEAIGIYGMVTSNNTTETKNHACHMDSACAYGGTFEYDYNNWVDSLARYGYVYGHDEHYLMSLPNATTSKSECHNMWKKYRTLRIEQQQNSIKLNKTWFQTNQPVTSDITKILKQAYSYELKDIESDHDNNLTKYKETSLCQWSSHTPVVITARPPSDNEYIEMYAKNYAHISKKLKIRGAINKKPKLGQPYRANTPILTREDCQEKANKVKNYLDCAGYTRLSLNTKQTSEKKTCHLSNEYTGPSLDYLEVLSLSIHFEHLFDFSITYDSVSNLIITNQKIKRLVDLTQVYKKSNEETNILVLPFNVVLVENKQDLSTVNGLDKDKLRSLLGNSIFSVETFMEKLAQCTNNEGLLTMYETALSSFKLKLTVIPTISSPKYDPLRHFVWENIGERRWYDQITDMTLRAAVQGNVENNNSSSLTSRLLEQLRPKGLWYKEKIDYTRSTRDPWRVTTGDNKLTKFAIGIPPMQGKTTFVKSPLNPGNVYDMDDLNVNNQSRINKIIELTQPNIDFDAIDSIHKSVNLPDGLTLMFGSSNANKKTTYLCNVVVKEAKTNDSMSLRNKMSRACVESYRLDENHPTLEFKTFEQRNTWLQQLAISIRDNDLHKVLGLRQKATSQLIVAPQAETDGWMYQPTKNELMTDEPDYIAYEPIMGQQAEGVAGVYSITPIEKYFMYHEDTVQYVNKGKPTNYLPGKPFQTTEVPGQIIQSTKTTLEPYPARAYPVLSRIIYAEQHSVANVLGSATTYRKNKLNLQSELRRFIQAYGCSNVDQLISKWRQELLVWNEDDVQDWLTQRTGIEKIDQEIAMIEREGLNLHPLNRLNVHVKLESLIKNTTINSFKNQQARIIVWQQKGITALFSPTFVKAKLRLKEFLDKHIIYADGYDPEELSARTRAMGPLQNIQFIEDDLTKQDRQTDGQMLELESLIYKNILGIHPIVVDLWMTAHKFWRFKGTYIKGTLNNMRQTGQASTALGNVIVNLLVHTKLRLQLGKKIKLMMVLGDDNLIITEKHDVNVQTERSYIRSTWNMESKMVIQSTGGIFLRQIYHQNSQGQVDGGPDIIRLRGRYSVTNNDKEATEEAIRARNLSYLMMLGYNNFTEDIKNKLHYELETQEYYEWYSLLEATKNLYGMTEHQVLAHWNELRTMMLEKKTYKYTFSYFTGASDYKQPKLKQNQTTLKIKGYSNNNYLGETFHTKHSEYTKWKDLLIPGCNTTRKNSILVEHDNCRYCGTHSDNCNKELEMCICKQENWYEQLDDYESIGQLLNAFLKCNHHNEDRECRLDHSKEKYNAGIAIFLPWSGKSTIRHDNVIDYDRRLRLTQDKMNLVGGPNQENIEFTGEELVHLIEVKRLVRRIKKDARKSVKQTQQRLLALVLAIEKSDHNKINLIKHKECVLCKLNTTNRKWEVTEKPYAPVGAECNHKPSKINLIAGVRFVISEKDHMHRCKQRHERIDTNNGIHGLNYNKIRHSKFKRLDFEAFYFVKEQMEKFMTKDIDAIYQITANSAFKLNNCKLINIINTTYNDIREWQDGIDIYVNCSNGVCTAFLRLAIHTLDIKVRAIQTNGRPQQAWNENLLRLSNNETFSQFDWVACNSVIITHYPCGGFGWSGTMKDKTTTLALECGMFGRYYGTDEANSSRLANYNTACISIFNWFNIEWDLATPCAPINHAFILHDDLHNDYSYEQYLLDETNSRIISIGKLETQTLYERTKLTMEKLGVTMMLDSRNKEISLKTDTRALAIDCSHKLNNNDVQNYDDLNLDKPVDPEDSKKIMSILKEINITNNETKSLILSHTWDDNKNGDFKLKFNDSLNINNAIKVLFHNQGNPSFDLSKYENSVKGVTQQQINQFSKDIKTISEGKGKIVITAITDTHTANSIIQNFKADLYINFQLGSHANYEGFTNFKLPFQLSEGYLRTLRFLPLVLGSQKTVYVILNGGSSTVKNFKYNQIKSSPSFHDKHSVYTGNRNRKTVSGAWIEARGQTLHPKSLPATFNLGFIRGIDEYCLSKYSKTLVNFSPYQSSSVVDKLKSHTPGLHEDFRDYIVQQVERL